MGSPPPALHTAGVLVTVFWEAREDAARLAPAGLYIGAVGRCGGFVFGRRWVPCTL